MKDNFYKIFRYIQIYGLSRTIAKVLSNGRFKFIKSFYLIRKSRSVGLIGCGNFAFSSTCFFLKKNLGLVFGKCFDINNDRAEYLAKFYGFDTVSNFDELFSDEEITHIYIASNHSTHAKYAINTLRHNKIPYIEKPIVVNYDQLIDLAVAKKQYNLPIYCGFNRPFSKAIQKIKNLYSQDKIGAITASFIIVGHKIDDDHWYRKPEEGSRVLANLSHWLDLAVYILSWKVNFPNELNISISYSCYETPSDNVNITITSDFNDIFVFTFTTRMEPINGVDETILFQSKNFTAKIDDFRSMKVFTEKERFSFSYFPKDVGHEKAILQPFRTDYQRIWKEIEISTLLILFIENMVFKKESFSVFDVNKVYNEFVNDVFTRFK